MGCKLFWIYRRNDLPHKNVTMPTFSSGELVWVSWQNKVEFFEYTWHGMIQGNMKNKQERIHSTEKPIDFIKPLDL